MLQRNGAAMTGTTPVGRARASRADAVKPDASGRRPASTHFPMTLGICRSGRCPESRSDACRCAGPAGRNRPRSVREPPEHREQGRSRQRFGSTPIVEEWDEGVRVTRFGRCASFFRVDICPSLPRVLWRLRDQGYDIIHVHAPNQTMFLALAALPSFSTLIVTHNSDVIKQRVLGRVFDPVERRVHERTAFVLSDSEAYFAGSPMLLQLGDKVRALPLGLDLAPFLSHTAEVEEAAARLRATVGELSWLVVARLVCYKGLTTAIDALAQRPGRLFVIGIRPMERNLRARAVERRVTGRVRWNWLFRPRQADRRVPCCNCVLVCQQCEERGLWSGSGRRNGKRMPGHQHGHSRLGGPMGLSQRRDRAHRSP